MHPACTLVSLAQRRSESALSWQSMRSCETRWRQDRPACGGHARCSSASADNIRARAEAGDDRTPQPKHAFIEQVAVRMDARDR
jgi:hypothetical protein